ncbi:MAG: hypothetical protein K2N23_05150 [Clostridia bacterium]|nr:hypothetical protein [Clostridia bacterium]
MNLKKYIKLKEEAPQEAARSEKEQELYNSLLQRVEQNAAEQIVAKRHASLWKILTPIISAACAIAITLTCVFTLRTPSDFVYNDDYIISKESTFEELQSDVKCFDLNSNELKPDQILLFSDSVSNDKLYYSVDANINLSKIDLVIAINEKYIYNFDIKEETVNKQLSDYTIVYRSESSRGRPQISYKGWIKVQTETVYFDYMQIPALGDEAFFESIQQIIKVKK